MGTTRMMSTRSNLPMPVRGEKMGAISKQVKGSRKVLGDITGVQGNKVVDVKKEGGKLTKLSTEVEALQVKDEEEALETFAYLRGLEAQSRVRENHLAGQLTNERMRAVLVDWLVEVQSQFKLLQETLHSTIDIIDRYMEVEGKSVSRSRLQLVGVSAMFLAAKIEEMYAPACSDFVYITDNAYSEEEIKATELKIVR